MGSTTGSDTIGPKTGRRKTKKPAPSTTFSWRPLSEAEAASEPPAAKPAKKAAKRPANPARQGSGAPRRVVKDAPPAINRERATFPEIRPRGPAMSPAVAIRLSVLTDWAILAAAFYGACRLTFDAPFAALPIGVAALTAAPFLFLKMGLWLVSAYAPGAHAGRAERALGGLALGAIAALGVAALTAPDARTLAALAAAIPSAAVAMAIGHAASAFLIARSTKSSALEIAVIVGATDAARRFIQRARESGRLHIAAIVDDRASRSPERVEGVPVCGSVEDLLTWPQLPEIDRIIVSIGAHAEARTQALIDKLRVLPHRVDLLVDLEKLGHVDRRFDSAANVACVSGAFTRPGRAFVKRAMDIVLGVALLVLLAPIMALVAVAVALDSPGPALIRQRRHGFNNRVIEIWRFRTLRRKTGEGGADKLHTTRVGRVLRRTGMHELPQLWSVLKGDMSLVGPRPHAVDMALAESDLSRVAADYAHRHRMRPGMTGWAQVNGARGPIKSEEALRERVRLDLEYVAHASFWLDLWILARAVPAFFNDLVKRKP